MYLLYIDESGKPELTDTTTRHYLLLGLSVHEGTWFSLEKRLQGLKRQFCIPGEDFELHASQFACDIPEQSEIDGFEALPWTERRRQVLAYRNFRLAAATTPEQARSRIKRYKRTEPFVHLTRLERSHLLEQSLELVGQHRGLILFGEAISKLHPAVTSGGCSPVQQAFEQVVARFDAFLKKKHEWNQQLSQRPKINNGLLVLDHDNSTEATLFQQFQRFRRHGFQWGELKHVLDVPFFAPSHRVSGLQLVDICAYATRRYFDKGGIVGSHEEANFQRIAHQFHRDSSGKLHGLRHYVPAGSCTCLVCQARGHSVT